MDLLRSLLSMARAYLPKQDGKADSSACSRAKHLPAYAKRMEDFPRLHSPGPGSISLFFDPKCHQEARPTEKGGDFLRLSRTGIGRRKKRHFFYIEPLSKGHLLFRYRQAYLVWNSPLNN